MKAFDCVNINKLWNYLKEFGLPPHLIGLMETLYAKQESCVKTLNGRTDWFRNKKGVRQGCVLSPHLFNLYTEKIMREVIHESDGVKIGGIRISNLRYADDMMLIADSEINLQNLIEKMVKKSEENGLFLNVKKTKILISGENKVAGDVNVNGEKLEQLDHFTYLESEVTEQCDSEKDIRKRLAIACSTYLGLDKMSKNRSISIKTKLRLLKALIWPIAKYGSESWTIKKADERRINAFEMWCYRKILRKPYTEHKTNVWYLQKIDTNLQLMRQLAKGKLKYFGHIKPQTNSLERLFIEGEMEGKRSRGRPKMRWSDNVAHWTQMKITEVGKLAQNRTEWRHMVNNALSSVR